MVGVSGQHPCDMGHGNADKTDRTAKCGDCSGQQRRTDEQQQACDTYVQSHGAGIVFSQQQQVQRFDQVDGEYESSQHDAAHQAQLCERNAAEASHSPDHERF